MESLPPDAKTRLILTRTAGVTSFVEIGTGPIRGMHAAFDRLFVLSGTAFYSVQSDGTATNLGTIPGSGRVSIAHNTSAVVVVNEPDAYWTDGVTASSVAQITDGDFTARGAKYVKFVDNYMLFTEPSSGRFFGAEVNSVTDFDSLDFATAEADPDYIVGMEVDLRDVILLGAETGEIWRNTGIDGFPFERVLSGFFGVGCLNGDTVARLDNTLFWLANDYTIRKLVGITPQRVSTHAIEQFLSNPALDVTTGRAYSYTQDGHFFYVLSFQSGCFVYDVTTGEWAERASYPEDYYRWQTHAPAHGRQYVGDAFSNVVGYFDPMNYTEDDDIQRMSWVFQPIYSENRRAFHKRLEVVLETGVGLTTGQGSDPEIMLDYSDDGGLTWDSMPNRKLGQIGEYQQRVYWNALGSARQRTYRMAVSDPVKITLADCTLEVEGGRI